MTTGPTSELWIVVFDVNVFIDVAAYVGEPFAWSRFQAEVAKLHSEPCPASNRAVDAMRAVALVSNGRVTSRIRVQVWTSDHIDALLRHKACQPAGVGMTAEDRGLGWAPSAADELVSELIGRTLRDSGGGSIGEVLIPRDAPPLEHEDGLVYASGREAFGGDVFARRFVVTSDKDFIHHGSKPGAYPEVLHPSRFVHLVRTLRAQERLQGMRPRPHA